MSEVEELKAEVAELKEWVEKLKAFCFGKVEAIDIGYYIGDMDSATYIDLNGTRTVSVVESIAQANIDTVE